VHRDETIFIKFEDLLAAPDQVLAEVWNVLGLDPASQRLNEDRIGLTKARDAAGIERWRTDLDRARRATIEQELGDALRRFGYATDVDDAPGPHEPAPPGATPPAPSPVDPDLPDPGPQHRDPEAGGLTPDRSPLPADLSADAPDRSGRTQLQAPMVPASS